MTWTLRKFILTGILSALMLILYLSISMPIVMLLGIAMGTVIMPFFTLLLLILFIRVIDEAGSAIILGFVSSLLFLPIPAFGPPGFLPKILIISGGCVVLEVFLRVLKRWPMVASTIGSAFCGLTIVSLMFSFFIVFQVPGAEKFLSIIPIFLVLAAVEASFGGFIGEKIYEKIKDRPALQRIRG